jgi:predicted DNA-binding mobile mystery protein A
MQKHERAALARSGLDARFHDHNILAFTERPTRGWVRAIRDALGMSSRQLAARMDISQPAVAQLERSEADGVVQLDTLRRAADALECDLVYVLVPRASLDEVVRNRARTVARADIATVDRTMRLEQQGLTIDQLERRIDDYATKLITAGRLWDEPGHP